MGSEKQQMGKATAQPAEESSLNEAEFKKTVVKEITGGNRLDVSCCQRGREQPRVIDAEPWRRGGRNEHEMLSFHFHVF